MAYETLVLVWHVSSPSIAHSNTEKKSPEVSQNVRGTQPLFRNREQEMLPKNKPPCSKSLFRYKPPQYFPPGYPLGVDGTEESYERYGQFKICSSIFCQALTFL